MTTTVSPAATLPEFVPYAESYNDNHAFAGDVPALVPPVARLSMYHVAIYAAPQITIAASPALLSVIDTPFGNSAP